MVILMSMEKMKKVSDTYKGGFFKNRNRLSWRAPIVADALVRTFDLKPANRLIDVGCAIGDYVLALRVMGYDAWGIEGSEAASPFFISDKIYIKDLRYLFKGNFIDSKYAIAFSLEVAEHIEPEFADVYVKNLCALSNTILISAACPGQKGHGHVNCQLKEYWIDLFQKEGFRNYPGYEARWREVLNPYRTKKELSSYYKNVICFGKDL